MKVNKLIALILLSLTCGSCGQVQNYEVKDYRTTMTFHEDFKIMQLTDLHLGIQGDLARNLNFVSKLIDDADPDLIVVTGDSFMYGSKGIVKNLFKMLNDKCHELTSPCAIKRIPQEAWTPVAAPSLWTKVLIPDVHTVPEWEQPSSTNPYQPGDKVMHNGKLWECTVANNVWEPGVYGWTEIND